jgi:delta8-fatty-acid desaturase
LAPLVRQFCKENGLTYHAYSFFNSNGLVRGVLKEVADQVKLLWRSADVDIRYKSQ